MTVDDYKRDSFTKAWNRAMDHMEDLGEWAFGSVGVGQRFGDRALLYLEKGRTPPRAFDQDVKLDKLMLAVETMYEYRLPRSRPDGSPRTKMDIWVPVPGIYLGIANGALR